ncbi:MAG: hypothetical protein DWQ06_00250 [Calditrichaeota bacterium]|nr:MAG: hypothetical protein DWQ06_00250 [Calditrichota bacterium]
MKVLSPNFRKVVQGIISFIILVLFSDSFAKVIFELENEIGFFNTSASESLNGSLIFDGKIKLNQKFRNNDFSLQANLKPEFYSSFKTLKFNTKGSFSQNFKKSAFISSINFRKNFYFLENSNFNYDIFKISLEGSHLLDHKNLILGSLNFYYRDFRNGARNNFDVISSEVNLVKPISRYKKYKIGFYSENFSIKTKKSYQTGKNEGFRLGTQFGFDYKKKFVLNFNYRILWHSDKLNGLKSYENWIRVLFAKVIFKKVTLLVLADFYLRNFDTQEGANLNLLYTSIDTENRVHLKIEKMITKGLDFYMKTGYQKEELVYNNSSLSGWNANIGVEIKHK